MLKIAAEVFVVKAVVVILVTIVLADDGDVLVVAEFTRFLLHFSIRGIAIFVPILL